MSTTSTQNKPSGYINISASIKSHFNCCNTTQQDVQNNKVNKESEDNDSSNMIRNNSTTTSIDLPVNEVNENNEKSGTEV